MLPGILIDCVQARKMLRRQSVQIKILEFGEAIGNSIERGVRLGQNASKVFPGDRPVSRVDQLPPPLH